MKIEFADGSTAFCDITDEFFDQLLSQVKQGKVKAYLIVNIYNIDYHINVCDVRRVAIANPAINVDRAQLARLGGKYP